MNFDQGVFAVVVQVATSRPPAAHAQAFFQIAADSPTQAIKIATQMAAGHPAVVMPVGAQIVSMVA